MAKLFFVGLDGSEKSYRLQTHRPFTVGRDPGNDIILRDPATSGHHARVERRGDQFWIVDLGSTNGTLVNGEPVQEKELSNGDRITIGQNAVNFSLIGPVNAASDRMGDRSRSRA